jgi:hypothetical protein
MIELPGNSMSDQRMAKIINTPAENAASEFYKRIIKMIMDFDGGLDEKMEVGARLVSFGQAVTINITGVGYSNPSLILFNGIIEDGSAVTLIQHVTQINFLLMAIKRKDPQIPKRLIGFYSEMHT